jgi:type I restriction enzyme S subunit
MTNDSSKCGWEELSFDEAVEAISDGGRRVDQRDYQPSGELPVIDQGEDFIGGYTDDVSKAYTGPLPVVVFGDHTRRVKLISERFAVGAQGTKLLRPRDGWDPKFFAYLLATLPIPNRGYSRHYQFIRKLTFPRPDLTEQRRIVAEIEKQFPRLDAGVASLKRVQTALKRYRASVLKAACEGRLVYGEAELARKENRSYETGQELLQRILTVGREKWNGKRDREQTIAPHADLPSLPEGWTWATVDQLSNVVRGASPRPAGDPKYFGGKIPWITVGPITADASPFLKSVPETVTDAGCERSRFIESHTLLLTNSGATLGVPKI